MTLRERLRETSADEMVYVGARTGWIHIARADEIEEKLEPYNAKYFEYYTQTAIPHAEKRLKILKRKINAAIKADKQFYARQLDKEKEATQEYMDMLSTYTDEWVDLMDREVKEEYIRRTAPTGTAFIIEGQEAGDYWCIEEIGRPKEQENKDTRARMDYEEAELKILGDETISHRECAELLKRPIDGIRVKRAKMGIHPIKTSTRANYKKWTPEEDELVLQDIPAKELAILLNRTPNVVRKRKSLLRKGAI